MDLASLEMMEMDDTLEDLANIVAMRKELDAERTARIEVEGRIARALPKLVQALEQLELHKEERSRLVERLALAEQRNRFLQNDLDAAMRAGQEERLRIDVGRQVVGKYTFKSHYHTPPLEVEAYDAFAITLVAVAGEDEDWACYMGRAGLRPHQIATNGDKVPVRHAEIFAHLMQHRHYRGY